MRRMAAMVLSFAGCFSKPTADAMEAGTCTFPPASQPSQPGMTVTNASGMRVQMGGAVVHFADDGGNIPFPDQIVLNNLDVAAGAGTCNFEDTVGVAAYPVITIGPHTDPTSPVHGLLPTVVGPAFSLFQVDWQHVYGTSQCNGGTTASGNTFFAFFPDGRVVRNDTIFPAGNAGGPTITLSSTDPGMARFCQCSGAGTTTAFAITSFTTLATNTLTSLTRGEASLEGTMLPTLNNVDRFDIGACVRAMNGSRLAVRWDSIDPPDPVQGSAPTRIRSVDNGGEPITALVYDMVASGDMQASVVPGVSEGIRTHMLLDATVDGTTCVLMQNRLRGQVNSGTLLVGGQPIVYSAHGVYSDEQHTHTGPVTIRPMSGTIPGGFVVALKIPSANAISTGLRTDVIWQKVTSGQAAGTFFIFFRDPLGAGDMITIQPEC